MNTFKDDLYRINGQRKWNIFKYFKLSKVQKFIYFFRKRQNAKSLISKKFLSYKLKKLSEKTHIDISSEAVIGPGLMIAHKGFVIVGTATLGKNITLCSGAVIGNEWRGKRKGCPIIGNNVYVGPNATIVGKINIGDDVLVAPNAFVNFDVPSHSIVIGNPGQIKHKDFATEEYQTYTV